MDRTAPTFFSDLERILWLDVSLHLCRLTDPSETGRGQRNVSLESVSQFLPAAIQSEYVSLVQQARESVSFARGWRNKLFAHQDLAVAAERNPKPLEAGNVDKVSAALRCIAEAMNFVERHFGVGPIMYDMQAGAAFGAGCLLTYLDERLAATEGRQITDPPRASPYL